MVQNPVILTRKSPILFRFKELCRKPTPHCGYHTRIPPNPLQITAFRSYYHPIPSIHSSHGTTVFRELGRLNYGFRQLFNVSSRVSAVSGGGSGGTGGGSGGGNSDGAGAGAGAGGENKWSFLSWYLALLEKHPVWTKAVTSAILTFVGDLICQIVIDQVPSLDMKRIFLFTFLGLALVGPTLHFWYLYLSKLITTSGASGAFLRLLVDQFLFAPVFIGVFLSTLVTLEGRPSQVMPKLQQEWFSSVIANWQLWIPFQFLNFRFVPQQFQVLAANFIALVWNVILSYKAHKEVIAK